MNDEKTKLCPMCKETKPLSKFNIVKSGTQEGNVGSYCKSCTAYYNKTYRDTNQEKLRLKTAIYRANNQEQILFKRKKYYNDNPEKHTFRNLKYKYGLSQEDYEKLPKECAICGSIERLQIDHNHNTGKVRNVLCRFCNLGIGHFKDRPSLLIRATDYMLKHLDQGPL